MSRFFSVLLAIFLLGRSAFGASPGAGCEGAVLDLTSLFGCADQLSPEVRRAALELEQVKLQLNANVQWRNPEFSVNSFSGSVAGSRQTETDLVLGVPIELGGKIGARRELSKASIVQAEAALLAARSTLRKELLIAIYRVRQLRRELNIVGESIKTFGTLIKQFSGRSRLSPEQETS